ncbi:hypothetical protein [Nocardiopsis dassonvillei]|uniref:hypothetical protein n=1 Tax=Nocardiopsis dassonvillei TaxID=2014 RepID=UPI00157BC7E1|nr:hypothetical protein [Nocardiopsis dassonvillei]
MADECPCHRTVVGTIGMVVERAQTVTLPAVCFDAVVTSLNEPDQPIEELASAVRRHRSAVRTV